ncbi:hypothetical protein D9M73_188750 [compost metagenome]
MVQRQATAVSCQHMADRRQRCQPLALFARRAQGLQPQRGGDGAVDCRQAVAMERAEQYGNIREADQRPQRGSLQTFPVQMRNQLGTAVAAAQAPDGGDIR